MLLQVCIVRKVLFKFSEVFKGTVSQICLFQFSIVNHLPQDPENNIRVISNFLENSRRYRWQILSIVPVVSLIPVANLPPCQQYQPQIFRQCQWHWWRIATGINNTGGKYLEQYQIVSTLNWTWRKKVIYMLILLPKGVQTKELKLFWLKICRGGAPWAVEPVNISVNFWKHLKWAFWDTQGLGRNWFMKKAVENLVALSL
jgi:hypothetical protein